MNVWFLKDIMEDRQFFQRVCFGHDTVIKFVMCSDLEGKNGQYSQNRELLELRFKCLRRKSFMLRYEVLIKHLERNQATTMLATS